MFFDRRTNYFFLKKNIFFFSLPFLYYAAPNLCKSFTATVAVTKPVVLPSLLSFVTLLMLVMVIEVDLSLWRYSAGDVRLTCPTLFGRHLSNPSATHFSPGSSHSLPNLVRFVISLLYFDSFRCLPKGSLAAFPSRRQEG